MISVQLAQLPQGVGRGPLFAVQAPRQDARHGGLAGTALAGKDVAVRDALLRDGVLERGLDVFLADQFGEGLGPVLAGDDLIHAVAEPKDDMPDPG